MPRARLVTLTLAAMSALSAPLAAQSTTTTPAATPAPAPVIAPFNFSGIIFGSYNLTQPTTSAPLPNQNDNSFILDRVYLNFRVGIAEHLGVRVTTDVYQTTEATQNAYSIRAKYAYLQYDGAKATNGSGVMARLGILQTVAIDYLESFWPRYLSPTAVDRAGYFSSSDVGVAGGYTLPNRNGEIYATVTNGTSYTSRERDRFKDYAIRLSLTPLASHTDAGLLQTLSLTGWAYKGATASGFVNGGAGQVGPVGEALDRSRLGLFAGIRDPRLILGAEYDRSHDGRDVGLNTLASPRTAGSVSGSILSGFTVVRPLAFMNGTGKSPFALIARYDQVKPSVSSENLTPPLPTDNAYHVFIGGVSYDVNPRLTFAADYQESLASNNGVSTVPAPSKGLFMHFSIGF